MGKTAVNSQKPRSLMPGRGGANFRVTSTPRRLITLVAAEVPERCIPAARMQVLDCLPPSGRALGGSLGMAGLNRLPGRAPEIRDRLVARPVEPQGAWRIPLGSPRIQGSEHGGDLP